MHYKKYFICSISAAIVNLIIIAALIIILDPFFHYHKPIDCVNYDLYNERYQNDGISKHFEYDIMITGTCLSGNFKISEANEIFSGNCTKTSFSGASLKEINDNLARAIVNNDKLKKVIRGIDVNLLLQDKDYMTYAGLPTYLYDEDLTNDLKYVINKNVLYDDVMTMIEQTAKGKKADFDKYSNHMYKFTYSKASVLEQYKREIEKASEQISLTDLEMNSIKNSIEQNIISLARENPKIEFYYYFTPYSILYFDNQNMLGTLKKTIDAMKFAASLMLEEDNIKFFSFFTDTETICNLDNYRDIEHYSEDVNSKILYWLHDDKYHLTKDNYKEYYVQIYDFYLSYDYNSIFSK